MKFLNFYTWDEKTNFKYNGNGKLLPSNDYIYAFGDQRPR
jgi:hypothetical protein